MIRQAYWSPLAGGEQVAKPALSFLETVFPKGESSMRHSKKLAALAIVAGVAATASAAFGWWSTNGSGTGAASTGSHTAVSVAQVGTVSGLVPGGDAQAIDFNINNPLSTNQYVDSVSIAYDLDNDGAGPEDTGMTWNAGCSPADFTLVQPTVINRDLVSGDTSFQPSGASLRLENRSSNQDGCKNQQIVLAFTIDAVSGS